MINEIIENQECFSIKDLKINGNDLISMGFKGRDIGKILNTILDLVIKEKIKNENSEIRDYIHSHFKP